MTSLLPDAPASPPDPASAGSFLPGGGATGALVRAHDWAATSLGSIERWPQALRTAAALVLQSPVPMVMLWGADGVMIYNDAYSAFAGGRHPQLLGSKVREGWPEVAEFNGHVMEVVLAGGTLAYRDQELVLHRSGRPEQVWMNLDYSPLLDEAGRPAGVLAVVIETTERVMAERRQRAAEEARSASEARLQGVLDRIGEGFILLGRDFTVLDVNPEGLRIEGRMRGEVVGRSHWEAWPGIRESELGAALERAMAEREPVALEHPYARADGARAWLDLRAYPVEDGLALFYRDITAKKRRADGQREAAERIELALNSGAILGTWVWDVPADRIVGDERFAHTFGLDPELCRAGAPLGAAMVEIHPDDRDRVAAAVAEALARGGAYRCEYRVGREGGGYRWVEANGRVEKDGEGNPLRFPGVLVDIDARKAVEEALREREGQLSALLEQATAGFAQVDLQGTFTLVNDRFCDITGRGREELLSLKMQDITHPDDLPANVPKFMRTVREGVPFMHEKRYVRPDGSIVWVNNSVSLVRDRKGEPAGVLAVSIDVTERRRAEAAVRENEARLRALTDNLPGGMVYQVATGRDGAERRFLFVSQSCLKLTGHPAEAIMADPAVAYAMIEPEDRPLHAAAEEEAIARRVPFDVETRFRRADGEVRWARFISAWREAADGGLVWDGIMIDVTARKQAEGLLRDLNETLEARVAERTAERDRAWRNTQDVLVTVGFDGIFRSVNPAWTRVLGHTEEETVGRSFREFIHPQDEAPTRAALEHATRDLVARFENRYRHKDGSCRWLSWMAAPEGDFVYASGRDVTLEREAAEELARAQEALRQSQKMEAMGQLTGGVAHDFNNLLTPIIGSLDLIHRKAALGAREHRLVEGALQSAERAKTLVQRLLAFARRQPLQAGAVDVAELVDGMAGLVDSTSGPSIRIETRVAPRLPYARADANQLEMAILNLAVNARDAMPDGGTITIAAEPARVGADGPDGLAPGEYVRLAVADTGIGMDEETLKRAVEPFFSTKGIGRGTGLGLSMVHGLAAQLGGALTLASRPGEGTEACLWLPLSHEGPAAEAGAPRGGRQRARTGRVLLVEDEPLVRASTADMLTDIGFEVVEADSADEALRLIAERRPDLVITDHLMPGLSGTELARRLAARMPDLPVILVSGYAEAEGLPPGVPRLSKPFRQSDLTDLLDRLLGAGE